MLVGGGFLDDLEVWARDSPSAPVATIFQIPDLKQGILVHIAGFWLPLLQIVTCHPAMRRRISKIQRDVAVRTDCIEVPYVETAQVAAEKLYCYPIHSAAAKFLGAKAKEDIAAQIPILSEAGDDPHEDGMKGSTDEASTAGLLIRHSLSCHF